MENILITGVSTGIGYSLCKVYLAKGCRVFGSVRKEEDAKRLSEEFGDKFHALIFDVTDHTAVSSAAEKATKMVGEEGLSCLINNAGIAVGGPIMFTSLEDYQRQFDVNLFGVIAVTKAFLPLLGAVENYKNPPGKILNISSVSGQIAFPFLSPYCASKFALEAFGDCLRREMLIYGIDVISIEPGAIKTPIWSKPKQLREDIKASVFWGALKKFYKQMAKSEESGMESDDLAYEVFRVYAKKNPKTRYVFMNKKFTNYTIPRHLIGPRKFDAILKKIYYP